MLFLPLTDETELQLLQMPHADDLYALIRRNRVHLRAWLPWLDDVLSLERAQAFCRTCAKEYADNGNFTLGLWYQGRLAGVVGLHPIVWADRRVALGYWLGADFQGKGLMTAACRAVTDHCFRHLFLNRVEIMAATGNARSRAVAERLGFTHEGTLRQHQWLYNRFVDLEMYGMLKEDWERR